MQTNTDFSFDNLSLNDLKSIMIKIYKGSNDQEVLQATQFLRAYGSTIQSVPIFVQLLTQDSVNEIRLLSAIILKKHIAPHLSSMSNEDRHLLQNEMLNRFFAEPSRKVQRSLALLIGVMMRNSFKEQRDWNDPLVLVSQKTKNDQPENIRIQGFLLLSTIIETTGEHLGPFYEDLFKFFMETIKDNTPLIRKQTLLCVLNMYITVNQQGLVSAFNEIYPMLLECFYQSLQEKDEDTIERVLEMLCALTQKKIVIFDNDKIGKLIELFCTNEGLLSKDLNPLFREAMVDIIQNITISYKQVLSKNEAMLRKVVEIIFTLACIKESKEELQDRDSIQQVALHYIRQAGILLPKKRSYAIFKDYIVKMFESGNDDVTEGAFLILGDLAEGCNEYLKRDLPTIMKNFIQKGLQSQNNNIKNAVFYAINLFSNYLTPDIIIFHPMIIPPLIKNLDNADQMTLLGNVISLEIFCQEMTNSIMKYLPDLIPRLMDLVDKPQNENKVKGRAILAVSSCAEVAEEKFVPYAIDILPLLAQLINMTDRQYIELKSSATKCTGTILGHCLKQNSEVFPNLIEPLIPTIYEGIKTTDNTVLKEYSFEFFYNLASYLKQDFKPYLQQIVELIFETIEISQTTQAQKTTKVATLDSDSEDENGNEQGWVDENVIEELAAAICCLGEMAQACPFEFAPYYERAVLSISDMFTHFHSTIRIQVLLCYKNIARAIIKLSSNGEIPDFTPGIPCEQRLSAEAEQFLFEEVYNKLFYTLEKDNNVHLLITATEVIQEFCEELGPASIDRKLEGIIYHLIKIFTNETNAQSEVFEGDEEVHGELFGSAILTVDRLIKSCREGFISYFDKLYPYLKKFAVSEDIPEEDIAEIIGCFSHVVKHIPSAAEVYGLDMLEVCVKALEFSDEYINSNVAYCVGMIVECGKEKIYAHYRVIMEKLRGIFDTSTLPETRDNALASLARMVYTNSSNMPLNAVVPNLIKEMPLRGQVKEEKTCMKMLIYLLETNPQALSGLEARCIELLIDAVIEREKYKIKDEQMIKAIGLILKKLSENESVKQIIQNCASKLTQENVDFLTQLLSTEY